MAGREDQAGRAVGVEASVGEFTAVLLEGDSVGESYSQPLDETSPTLPQLVEFVDGLRERFGAFENIGIAMPGLVHRETRRVAYSAHAPEHSDIDMAEQIWAETGVHPVIENDANAAAYGEYKLGAGQGSRNLFYATLGKGIGGAFIFDGQIWRGSSGFAGEIGYIAINSDGMRLEDVASTDNIVRRTRSRFNRDSTSSLNRFNEQAIHIADIVTAAENGDDFAQLMLERTGSYVGTAVSSVINLLNVERIVLGGVIMHAGHLVLDAVIRRAKELSFAPSFQNVEIVAGTLGEHAAAIGAALIAREG